MDVEIRDIPSQPCVYMSRETQQEQLGEFFMEAFPKVFGYVMQNGGPGGPPFGRYPRWGETDCVVEGGVATPTELPGDGEILSGTVGGGRAATATHVGPYEGLKDAWGAMFSFVEEKGLKPAGAVWECYMNSPEEVPADQLQTQMFLPVE